MADLRLYAQNEGALYQGGSGNDSISVSTGAISASTIQGLDGNDLIFLGNETNPETIKLSGGADGTIGPTAGNATAGLNVSGFFESAGLIGTTFATALSSGQLSAGGSLTYNFHSLVTTGLSGIATSTVNANAGNDSIFLGDQLRSVVGGFIAGGKGNDLVGTYNSGGATTGKINATLTGSTINGGEGNDTVFVNFSGASAKDFVLNGNAGNDSVVFSSVSAAARSALIGGGQGQDTILASFASGSGFTINGGAGNDTITFDANSAVTKSLIQGDTLSTHSGDDTINIMMDAASSLTIQGLGGNDSIVISTASGGGGNLIAGNDGKDTIYFSAGAVASGDISGWTVNGGAGADSILLTAVSAKVLVSAIFNGGVGDDTITLAAGAGGSAGASGVTINGGAGADSLTNSAMQSAGGVGVFGYGAYSDSTLTDTDTVTFSTAAVSAGGTTYGSSNVRFSFTQGGIALASGAGALNTQISATGGFVVFSGYSDASLTSRVSAIDASYTTTGNLAVFTTDNTTRYIFVQGGSTDTLIKLSNEQDLSAGLGTISVTGGSAIGFGA